MDLEKVDSIFADRFGFTGPEDAGDGEGFLENLSEKKLHFFHLTKVAGDRELCALY